MLSFINGLTWLTKAVSAFYFFKLMGYFVKIRERLWAKGMAYITAFAIISMVVYNGDIVNVGLTMITFAVTLLICYEGELIKRISLVLILYPVAVCLNFFAVDAQRMHYRAYGANTLMENLIYLGMNIAILFIWMMVGHLAKGKIEDVCMHIDKKTWVLIDIMCLAPFISSIYTIVSTARGEEFKIYPVAISSIVTSLGMFFLIEYIIHNTKAQFENRNLKMQYSYYKELEENQLQVRRLQHDMQNHLAAMGACLESQNIEQAEAYFHSVENKFHVSNRIFCKNSIVNAVLNAKYAVAESKGMDCFFKIDLQQELMGIEDIDLCALFANTLDNAIEALEKVQDPAQRKMTVKARCDKGYFTYTVTNYKVNPIHKEANKFVSDKQDAKKHGYGMENVRAIVEKYQGTLDISHSEKDFSVLCIIKIV